MKRVFTLLVVCALVVFTFGDSLAAKKIGTTGAPQEQIVDRFVEPVEIILPQGEISPLPVRRVTDAVMVPIVPGTYTIGAAGTYTSLAAAVDALQMNGIDSTLVGNIIFEFIDAAYTDTNVTIGGYAGQYGSNMVIFRPAAANVATITFSGGVGLFGVRINNGNNIVWDGSNSGGSDRSLTLTQDTVTALNRNTVLIQSGSKNITIENMIIQGPRRAGALTGGADPVRIVNTGFAAFGAQNNITIHNNHIHRGANGISQVAANGGLRDTNLVITDNLIGGGAAVDIPAHLARYGVDINGNENAIITGNDFNGIYVYSGTNLPTGVHLGGNYVNALVTKNRIHNVVCVGLANFPQGIRAANALLSSVGVRASAVVANNWIYDLHNFATTAPARGFRGLTYTTTGAAAGLGTTIYWVHNTVALDVAVGEALGANIFMVDYSSFGGSTFASSPDTAVVRNNIFYSDRNGDAAFTRTYLMFAPAVATNFNLVADNNNFYQTDGGAFAQWGNPYPSGAPYVGSMAEWQLDSGNDLASVVGDPRLVAPLADLHIDTSPGSISAADSVGAPLGLAATAVDYDMAPRDPLFPDAGAIEFAVTRHPIDLAATSVDFPSPTNIIAAGAAFSPMGTFTNHGSTTLSGALAVFCEILDAGPSVVYTSGPTPITAGGYDNTGAVTFASVAGGLPAGTYTIRIIAAIPGDAAAGNDTLSSALLVQASVLSSSFPYTEDFEDPSPETGGAGWLSSAEVGSPNDWVIGTPAKAQISGAHSGVKAYVTKTTGDYSVNQDSYIFAPILDLTSFTGLLLVEFYSNFAAEFDFDGGEFQMSTDGGSTWSKVDATLGTGGNFNTPTSTAWYNSGTLDPSVLAHITPPLFTGGLNGGTSSAGYSSAVAGWVRSSTVLSGLAGLSDVRFRWHFSADGGVNEEGWAIDDVTFKGLPADDIGLASLGIPGYVGGPVPDAVIDTRSLAGRTGVANHVVTEAVRPGAYLAAAPVDVEAVTQNFGANGQPAYTVEWELDNVAQTPVSNADPLDFGDADTLLLSSSPATGFHDVKAWTVLGGDAEASNDTATFAFEVLAPNVIFYEGFNGLTFPPAGWDTVNNDANTHATFRNWFRSTAFPSEGAGGARSLYLSANGFTIDDWLITPNTGGLLDVSYTVDSLSFWLAGNSSFADSLMILVSTSTTDLDSFTIVLDYIKGDPVGYNKYTYALPDAANRYIAFRYLHYDGGPSGGSSDNIFLDDVRITRYSFENGFVADPTSLSFGSVAVGFDADMVVNVVNPGNVDLNISSITSSDAAFTVDPLSGVVAGGETLAVTVTFTPSSETSFSGDIVFAHDAASSPDTVTVTGIGGAPLLFLSVSPDTIIAKDPIKLKFLKSVKRAKPGKPITMPNWANLLDETVAQGGFGPGASTGDSAGGAVIGVSYMFKKNPADPLKPKWSPVKDSANIYAWVRLTKWDFKKNLGKGYNALQKTLENKTFNHLVDAPTHRPRGFDSTLSPGMPKRKQMKKQATKLDSKKTPNNLFAELVALKVNIAASQMGKTPAGFGELIFDVDTSAFDEMEVKAISEKADSMMTYWQGYTPIDSLGANYAQYDDLYNAVHAINRAFLGPLDTLSFMQGDSTYPLGKLVLKGQGNLAAATYLKLPDLFRPVMKAPTTYEVESGEDEDFEDEEWDSEAGVPVAAKLYQNYPNPFNPATKISFRLLEESAVTIKIFNMLGQEVATLVNGEQLEEGLQVLEFAPASLASGVYFYRIDVQGLEDAGLRTVETRKMVLLK